MTGLEVCPLCDGTGLMAAVDPYKPDAAAHVVWCPACDGAGAHIHKEIA